MPIRGLKTGFSFLIGIAVVVCSLVFVEVIFITAIYKRSAVRWNFSSVRIIILIFWKKLSIYSGWKKWLSRWLQLLLLINCFLFLYSSFLLQLERKEHSKTLSYSEKYYTSLLKIDGKIYFKISYFYLKARAKHLKYFACQKSNYRFL